MSTMNPEDPDKKSSCHCCGYPASGLREYPGPIMPSGARGGTSLFCHVCAATFLSLAITYPQLHGESRLLFSSLGWIANEILNAIKDKDRQTP